MAYTVVGVAGTCTVDTETETLVDTETETLVVTETETLTHEEGHA